MKQRGELSLNFQQESLKNPIPFVYKQYLFKRTSLRMMLAVGFTAF